LKATCDSIGASVKQQFAQHETQW